jgi:TRAP-type mannitol/chloroaromatic compound transport system permease small subunit
VLKTLIPLFALMLALQGLSQAIKSIAMLTMLRIGRRRAAKAAR